MMHPSLCPCRSGQGARGGGARTGKCCSSRAHWAPLPCLLLVAVILWCTPLPHLIFDSCDRPCHDLEWPMICRFKLVVEAHCPSNLTGCRGEGGPPISTLVANRMIPGPTLKVCENDIVVVDLVNLAMGQSLALHWSGQSQKQDPYMDGVPQVTQCPVNPYNTFQYKFRATGAGTHLWSATGSPLADSVSGALVVRQSATRDPHSSLYDEDQHVLSLSVFRGQILVNGQVDHEAGGVVPGRRYRIRMLYSGSGSSKDLPLKVRSRGQGLLLIALDGHPVRPRLANSFSLRPGERADVVMRADQQQDSYALEVEAEGQIVPAPAPARALLHSTSAQRPQHEAETEEAFTEARVPTDVFGEKASDIQSFQEIEGLERIPDLLSQEEVDTRLYLPFHNEHGADSKPGFCNISLALPAAPLLSQLEDAEVAACSINGPLRVPICRGEAQPAAATGKCTHIIHLPLRSSVEIILVDQGGTKLTPSTFHLHGYSFWVVGEAPGPAPRGTWQELAAADQQGALLTRTLAAPLRRDTVRVPPGGLVAIRFVADNPGFWLLRERAFYQMPDGLGVILQVGDPTDLPPVPNNFPKCGSFTGPDFLLI